MKKAITSILLVIMIFSFSERAYGNSGPVFWQGYPSSDVMLIKENSPIIVNKENLVFDFSNNDGYHYTIGGRVTATYEMFNPTNETQLVQMAFPYIEGLESISPDEIVISADNKVLPYDMYIGNVVRDLGSSFQEGNVNSFDFADILSTITDEPYVAENFEENEKGKLYIIEVKPRNTERINLAVDFNFDDKKTKVLTKGFNRYERQGEKTRIAAWCYEPELLEIYVLGEEIDLKINGYRDGALEEKTDLFTYQVSSQEETFRSYLMRYVQDYNDYKSNNQISDNQLYNMYAKSLDEHFTRHGSYSSEDGLMGQKNLKRILTLVYTVEFPKDSKKEVSISYNTSGTMDKRKTAHPLYTFNYILNPAENWEDFNNLNIEIITPQQAPYVVESNIQMIKKEENLYKATLADLPEEDLYFSLYANEKITLLDKIQGSLQNNFGYFTPLVIGGMILFIIAGTIFFYKRKGRGI